MSHMRTESWRIHTDTDTFTIIRSLTRDFTPYSVGARNTTPICESNVTSN